MKSWLYKRKHNPKLGLKRWVKRWFVLERGFLSYFSSETQSKPAGWLRAAQIQDVEPDEESATQFTVHLQSRAIILRAENVDLALRWQAALQAANATAPLSSVFAAPTSAPPSRSTGEQVQAVSPVKRSELTTLAAAPALKSHVTTVTPQQHNRRASFSVGTPSPHGKLAAQDGSALPTPGSRTAAIQQELAQSKDWEADSTLHVRAEYTRCWDNKNDAFYFVDDSSASYWVIPQQVEGGEWVLVWDFTSGALYWHHTGTGAQQFSDPSVPPGASTPSASKATGQEHDLTQFDDEWMESWDAHWGCPYFVNLVTGESQWEAPEHVQIAQEGTEDFECVWEDDATHMALHASGAAVPSPGFPASPAAARAAATATAFSHAASATAGPQHGQRAPSQAVRSLRAQLARQTVTAAGAGAAAAAAAPHADHYSSDSTSKHDSDSRSSTPSRASSTSASSTR